MNSAAETVEVAPWRGNDEAFLELLTKVVFCTGFSRSVVERRWPAFVEAFAGFAIDTVMRFDEPVTEELVSRRSGIIRNARKINATVANAVICQTLLQDYGTLQTFASFVQSQSEREGAALLRKTFRQVGETAAVSLYHALQGKTDW